MKCFYCLFTGKEAGDGRAANRAFAFCHPATILGGDDFSVLNGALGAACSIDTITFEIHGNSSL